MDEPKLPEEELSLVRHAARRLPGSGGTRQAASAINSVLARLKWLEAELAALAPLRDILSDVYTSSLGSAERVAAEIGAARARERMRHDIAAGYDDLGATMPGFVSKLIRADGPCLSPPPAEAELERLRKLALYGILLTDNDRGGLKVILPPTEKCGQIEFDYPPLMSIVFPPKI